MHSLGQRLTKDDQTLLVFAVINFDQPRDFVMLVAKKRRSHHDNKERKFDLMTVAMK
jgi:hypothetical protein